MKAFDRLIAAVVLITIGLACVVNYIAFGRNSDGDKFYKVEINRVEQEINNGGDVDADDYDTISGVYKYGSDEDFYDAENEYVIREINGEVYRIEYDDGVKNDSGIIGVFNIAFGILFLIVLIFLLYIRNNIVKPFAELSDYPYQLAKGNLSVPLKENSKKRFFGKFIWGLDMLRETLEKSNMRELERAKKEKTFLMSLSHDIKTPLSAIKLYSKAVSKGMYTEEKQIDAMENINSKADEIEKYVNEIIKNLGSDFMAFDVNMTEFYLSQAIDSIKNYYADRLDSVGTEFIVDKYTDCLVSGDPDRTEEVLQNIIENAVKYGDGRRISIDFSDEEDFRLITVSNSGCTLNESELPYIFDSFRRGSNAENKQGCGLGLYICRRLTNSMNGDIFAEISGDIMSVTVVLKLV